MAMKYSTKYVDERLEDERSEARTVFRAEQTERCFQWVKAALQERKCDQLIDEYISLFGCYSANADCALALDGDFAKAKRQYYMAALTACQFFRLARARFRTSRWDGAGPYNFKKHNFNFSKDAILANAFDLALSIAGPDTIEGLLLMEDYEKARRMLPKDAEAVRDDVLRCMWGIAWQEQAVFDEALKERVKMLRKQGSHCATILDSWGLALVQLARRRGMSCKLNVTELPWKLLDDEPADKTGLRPPFEDELEAVLRENAAGMG